MTQIYCLFSSAFVGIEEETYLETPSIGKLLPIAHRSLSLNGFQQKVCQAKEMLRPVAFRHSSCATASFLEQNPSKSRRRRVQCVVETRELVLPHDRPLVD